MITIFDSEKRPTTLRAGDCIIWRRREQSLMLYRSEDSPVFCMYWANGNDKQLAHFIRSEDDFQEFAMILAETHGFSIRKDQSRPTIPVWVFHEVID